MGFLNWLIGWDDVDKLKVQKNHDNRKQEIDADQRKSEAEYKYKQSVSQMQADVDKERISSDERVSKYRLELEQNTQLRVAERRTMLEAFKHDQETKLEAFRIGWQSRLNKLREESDVYKREIDLAGAGRQRNGANQTILIIVILFAAMVAMGSIFHFNKDPTGASMPVVCVQLAIVLGFVTFFMFKVMGHMDNDSERVELQLRLARQQANDNRRHGQEEASNTLRMVADLNNRLPQPERAAISH